MKKLSLLLALILCLCSVGCDKATDGTANIGVSTEVITETTTENVLEAPTEPTDAPIEPITADEAWGVLSDALALRDGRYEYICESVNENSIDGIECYKIHVRTHGTETFYDKNGDEVSSEFTYGFFAVDKYSGTVYELSLDMEHLKEFGQDPSDLPFDPGTVDDYAYLCENSDTSAYMWIKAILDKDPAVCTDIAFNSPKGERRHEEWYHWLYKIKLGDYSIKVEKNDKDDDPTYDTVTFDFEVVESEYSIFPVGEYSYVVESIGLNVPFYWNRINKPAVELDEWISGAIWMLSPYVLDLDISDISREECSGIFWVALDEKGDRGSEISAADLADAAYAIFGIENFASGGTVAIEKDGVYSVTPRGGDVKLCDIVSAEVDGDITKVYLQYYGDEAQTVKSCYVEYVFEKTEGEYPYRILSIKTIDEGIKGTYGWSM